MGTRRRVSREERRAWIRWSGRIFALALLVLAVWYAQRKPTVRVPRTVTIYGFSAIEDALRDSVLPAFQSDWEKATGERIEWVTTFAGSGAIVDRILDRVPAELAVLASEIDASRVLPGGRWRNLPHNGVLTRSPMVILVRGENPKAISSLADLLRQDVSVVQCDPTTSGAGEWSILAIDEALKRSNERRGPGAVGVHDLHARIQALEPSASAALRAFVQDGLADALVTYESEWLAMEEANRAALGIVYPPHTILSEHILIRIDQNIDPDNRDLIDGLIEFLWSERAQKLLQSHGFQASTGPGSADDSVRQALTLAEIGGPDYAARRIRETWFRGSPQAH